MNLEPLKRGRMYREPELVRLLGFSPWQIAVLARAGLLEAGPIPPVGVPREYRVPAGEVRTITVTKLVPLNARPATRPRRVRSPRVRESWYLRPLCRWLRDGGGTIREYAEAARVRISTARERIYVAVDLGMASVTGVRGGRGSGGKIYGPGPKCLRGVKHKKSQTSTVQA